MSLAATANDSGKRSAPIVVDDDEEERLMELAIAAKKADYDRTMRDVHQRMEEHKMSEQRAHQTLEELRAKASDIIRRQSTAKKSGDNRWAQLSEFGLSIMAGFNAPSAQVEMYKRLIMLCLRIHLQIMPSLGLLMLTMLSFLALALFDATVAAGLVVALHVIAGVSTLAKRYAPDVNLGPWTQHGLDWLCDDDDVRLSNAVVQQLYLTSIAALCILSTGAGIIDANSVALFASANLLLGAVRAGYCSCGPELLWGLCFTIWMVPTVDRPYFDAILRIVSIGASICSGAYSALRSRGSPVRPYLALWVGVLLSALIWPDNVFLGTGTTTFVILILFGVVLNIILMPLAYCGGHPPVWSEVVWALDCLVLPLAIVSSWSLTLWFAALIFSKYPLADLLTPFAIAATRGEEDSVAEDEEDSSDD